MSIAAITFELDDHTIQIVHDDMLVWIDGDTEKDPDIVLRLADVQRVLSTASMLIKEPA